MAYHPSVGNIEMSNYGRYIYIKNTSTNDSIYVLKDHLIIRKENEDTLFIKNQNYMSYFNYADIVSPPSDNIDDLIALLILYVNDYIQVVTLADAGGTLKVPHAFLQSSPTVIPVATNNVPILSVSVPVVNPPITIVLRNVSILNTISDTIAEWKVVYNPVLTGATFGANTGSQVLTDDSATSYTGGSNIASGYIHNISKDVTNLSYISVDSGNSVTLVGSAVQGAPSLLCSIDWTEAELNLHPA